MRYDDYIRQSIKREDIVNEKNEEIAEQFLTKYLKNDFFLWDSANPINYLLYKYFAIKGTTEEQEFLQLLESYNFCYSESINNAIYYLLATEKERNDSIDPSSWPGVYEIKNKNPQYILKTILGTIEVYKASDILTSSKSIHIFDKPLMGQCYRRSYDFLKENHDYHAVLSYQPNFFYGGHYHAYLEKDSTILDIAANALSSSASIVLCGKILAKLSYRQIKQKHRVLKMHAQKINNQCKLLNLALYFDYSKKK